MVDIVTQEKAALTKNLDATTKKLIDVEERNKCLERQLSSKAEGLRAAIEDRTRHQANALLNEKHLIEAAQLAVDAHGKQESKRVSEERRRVVETSKLKKELCHLMEMHQKMLLEGVRQLTEQTVVALSYIQATVYKRCVELDKKTACNDAIVAQISLNHRREKVVLQAQLQRWK